VRKPVAVRHGLEALRTHDLAALWQAIPGHGGTLPLAVDQSHGLNPFTVQFRDDDEIIPAAAREQLDAMLIVMLRWIE
jgi:hypothetical protein